MLVCQVQAIPRDWLMRLLLMLRNSSFSTFQQSLQVIKVIAKCHNLLAHAFSDEYQCLQCFYHEHTGLFTGQNDFFFPGFFFHILSIFSKGVSELLLSLLADNTASSVAVLTEVL